MTTTEIIEGNKLIAEFMGAKPCSMVIKSIGDVDGFAWEGNEWAVDELEYHSSWDWLMPVVEKIEGLSFDDGLQVQIVIGDCYIYANNSGMYFQAVGNDKIKSTWEAVVQFIQWYNTQNK